MRITESDKHAKTWRKADLKFGHYMGKGARFGKRTLLRIAGPPEGGRYGSINLE